MTSSILDQYCAEPHQSPITAAAFDPHSGASVTGDAWGTVAVTRAGEKYPALIFTPGGPINGALALNPGGSLVAVGDDDGSVNVYKCDTGDNVFNDLREGAEGRARAMRAMAFNPAGTILAALSVDGIIRIYDIQRWERIANYRGFGGDSLEFDYRGDNLLAIDNLGQPKRIEMLTRECIDLELVPGGVRVARFTPSGDEVITIGQSGITLIDVHSGRIANSFTASGSSGMLNVVISPDATQLGAVTGRSVHVFSLPDLTAVDSKRHGAPDPTSAAWWDFDGVCVAGSDGQMHRPGERARLEPAVCVTGIGAHRVVVHGDKVSIWHKHRRKRPFGISKRWIEVKIDRNGRLLAGLPESGPVQIYDARTGKHLFDAPRDTVNSARIEVGGAIVAAAISTGGMRWWDLENNQVLELPWVQDFALTGSGTWIAAITPKGVVHIIDPRTGRDAMPPPEPVSEAAVVAVAFINKQPDMLVLDEDGVLSIYELKSSVEKDEAAEGEDILDFNVPVDRMWGITGGRHVALRIQDYDNEVASIVFVDLDRGEVVSEINDLLPYAWVDAENGNVMEPSQGNALYERDMYGEPERVLRSLPEGEWIAFTPDQVLDASEGAL